MGNYATQLNGWFQTPLGKRLLIEENHKLQQILPHLFGYYLLQIDNIGYGCLLDSSLIKNRFILCQSTNIICNLYPSIYTSPTHLPIIADSVDVVILPHILEFESEPHAILREIERILVPEGYIIIIGFNPVSLWGLWHYFLIRSKTPPWNGHFLPLLRIKDWLNLLGFDLVEQNSFFTGLPFEKDYFSHYFQFWDKMSMRWIFNLGSVYIVVAKKRVATLMPIRKGWQVHPTLVTEVVSTNFNQNK
ncbi:MAG: methyltransferase domain-containing protein [Thiomargarita sp.]|nr:methyltransferase domain-containing protein [Thiomargarita sp.]